MRIYFEPSDCEFIVYRLDEQLLRDYVRFPMAVSYEGRWESNPFKNHQLPAIERMKIASELEMPGTIRVLNASATARYEVREDGKVAQVYEVSLV